MNISELSKHLADRPTLAGEIEAYLAENDEDPRFPPCPQVLARWAKRAATLVEVRDELLAETDELRRRVKALERAIENAEVCCPDSCKRLQALVQPPGTMSLPEIKDYLDGAIRNWKLEMQARRGDRRCRPR